MKVIFLDFDGVMNSAEFRRNNEDYRNNFIDESRMKFLKDIVEKTGAVIVLTTTWRLFWREGSFQPYCEGEKINAVFEKYGLRIFSKTEPADDDRNLEILIWLCSHRVESYVILDDIDFNWSGENRKRFVKTDDASQGLDEKTAERAIEILNDKRFFI